MADCECLGGCPFFHDKMASMPQTAEMIKAQYCQGERADNDRCGRHMVFAAFGRENVPTDLYPSDYGRALEMLG